MSQDGRSDDGRSLICPPFSESSNPKVLQSRAGIAQMPHQPPSSPGAWRSKKCRSFKLPQHSSGRLWGEGLSTFAAAAPRTGLPLSPQPPKMYIPLAASLHTAVCSARAVGAVPLKVTSDHLAACRQRGWKRSFGARFAEFCLDSKCQKPLKILCKN